MGSVLQCLDFDEEGAAESEAVRILGNIVRDSMERGKHPWADFANDVRRARNWTSSFGLSPEFQKWSTLFERNGGVWTLDDAGFFHAIY